MADLVCGVVIKDGRLNLIEVQHELLRDDVLNMRSEGDIIVACEGGEGRVCAGSLGDELLRASFGGGRILRDTWLDAFYGKPVGCLQEEARLADWKQR